MKKLLSILLVFILCFSLASCVNKDAEFKTAYTGIYAELQNLNESCDKLTGTIYKIWNVVGVDNVMGTLTYMLQVNSDFDTYWNNETTSTNRYYECLLAKEYGWLNNSTYGISFSADAKEFHALCMDLQATYSSIATTNEGLSDKMKELYSEYSEDYKNEYDLINELYLEVSIYAEFALNPSGSLNSYSTEMNEMQQEISKLIKAADIY